MDLYASMLRWGLPTPSDCPTNSAVGTLVVDWLPPIPAKLIAAFSEGLFNDASRAPAPPAEWPVTASRSGSTRSRTGLVLVR